MILKGKASTGMIDKNEDKRDAQADADVFRAAAGLNRNDPFREGSILRFPNYGQVVMTGDLHGHARNFRKLQKYADLMYAPARHVVLHELIHAEPDRPMADDASHDVVLAAARWKTEFPDQVHFLQSNHEMAQLTGKEICKGGRVVTQEYERSLVNLYGQGAADVLRAVHEYIESFPLAARTANRIFLSHSLPNVRDLSAFDPGVIQRELRPRDYGEGGDAYVMVWGRHHTPDLLDTLAKAFDVDWFISGHQPQENGWSVVHDRMIILASDHNHGVFLPFDLKKMHGVNDLAKLIRPFAGIE